MSNVTEIFPANDMATVLENSKGEVSCGLVIGYNKDGDLVIFGGGMINGRQPTHSDWNYMIDRFKHGLIGGEYG